MKKITGFFMAFLPFFIVMLLFGSGLLVKEFTTIAVTSVEISRNELELKMVDPMVGAKDELEAHVLPMNATNPEIYWASSNEDIVTVEKDTGVVNAVGYGEAKIYAISSENQTISATCDVEVWDDQIHAINVANENAARYIGLKQSVSLDAVPVPNSRIDGDPSLEYSSLTPAIAEVSSDGIVTAKSAGEAKIQIKCHDSKFHVEPYILDVYVGNGVSSIYFENESNIAIKDIQYDLYKDLLVYPQPSTIEKQFLEAQDFEFESSNEAIATIDDKGVVKFKQPGQATFSVIYKRNRNIKASKSIESSGGVFNDVSFNVYNFTADLSELDDYIDPTKLYATVYPLSDNPQTGYTITSSNEDVIKPIFDDGKYNFLVNGAGDTTLTASIHSKEGTVVNEDKCFVHITDVFANTFLSNSVELKDSAYYWLRSNVNTNVLTNKHSIIEWEYTPNPDTFTVDLENEIVHFKKPGSTKFWIGMESFTLTCNYTDTKILGVNQKTYILEAGKRYQFNDGTNTWLPTFGETDSFDIDNDSHSFIAKSGCYDKNVSITNGRIIKNAYVIVREKPLDIKYSHTYMPYLVTSWASNIYMDGSEGVINAKVVPTTATGDDGKSIKVKYEFKPHHEGTTYIWPDTNVIDFLLPDVVDVTAKADLMKEEFSIKSTYGLPSKFALFEDYDETQPIQSGEHITLVPGDGPKTFYINASASKFVRGFDYPSEIFPYINVSTLNGDKILNVSKSYEDPILGVGGYIAVTVEPKKNVYGNETLIIETYGFKYLLYIDVENKITDFDLSVNWQQLTNKEHKTITTYTNNFIADIILNSPSLSEETYTYNLNDTGAKIVVDNKIDFSQETLNIGDNKLVLDSGDMAIEFTITRKSLDNLSFILDKETKIQQKQTLFVPAGHVSTVLTIVPDGIVENDIYKDFKLEFKNVNINVKPEGNKFVITNIPDPSDEQIDFNVPFTVTYNSGTPVEYVLARETITKITFPGHDNLDRSDQKGLQQVHVFGNQSFYNEEEGLIDYYKLPLEIYDYQHKKITDLALKRKAWKSLIPTTNNGTYVEYDKDNGYLKVYFDTSESEVYTPEQMYNDEFASGAKHNTILTVSTPSGFVSKSYEFVTVKGINSYHQDAFEYARKERKGNGVPVVLQTNFGLKDESVSAPLDNIDYCYFDTIYGNGYTMNFDTYYMSLYPSTKARKTRNNNIFNTNIVGCYPEHDKKANSSVGIYEDIKVKGYFAYDTISYTNRGFNFFRGYEAYVKNCLFYNNFTSGINISEQTDVNELKVYVQDCILFNCSSIGISCSLGAEIYLKGFIDIYNFQDKSVFSKIEGYDLSFLWDWYKDEIYASGAVHQNLPDGIDRLNGCMVSLLAEGIYFWNDERKGYDRGIDCGNQWTLPYLKKSMDVDIPYIGNLKLWATLNNVVQPLAPSYFDQFDENGYIRWGFMTEQIDKIVRFNSKTTIYPY